MNKKKWFYILVLIIFSYVCCDAQHCDTLYQTAMAAYKSAKWDTAYLHFDTAKNCFKNKQEWKGYTDCNRGMSFALSKQDKYDKIPSLLLSVIDTLKKQAGTTGQHRSLIGKVYGNLGGFYTTLKNSDEAIFYLNRSLERTDNTIEKIPIYTNLGVAYEDKLDYEKSITYHSKVLNILSDTFIIQNKTIDKVRTLNNLGQTCRRYKRYKDAHRNFQTGLKLLKKFQPQNDIEKKEKKWFEVCYYNNLGVLHTHWEKYGLALEYLNQIRKMDLTASEIQHYHLNLGYTYLAKQNYSKAIQSFKEYIVIKEQLLSNNKHIDKAIAYSNLGEAYYKQGIWQQALDNLQQALIQAIPTFNDTTWETTPDIQGVHHVRTILITLDLKAKSLYEYYQTTQNKADLDAALATYQTALQLVDKIRIEQQHEESVFSLLQTARPIYEGAIEAAYAADEPELVYQLMEKSKAVVLLTALRDAGAKLTVGIPDSLLYEERDLKAAIAYNKQKLNEAQQADKQEKIKEYNTVLFEKREQLQKLLSQLETDYPEYYTIKYNTDVADIDELKNKLKAEKSTAIEYFMGDSTLYACVIGAENIALHQFEKGANFETALTDFLSTISNPSPLKNNFIKYTNSAIFLYQNVLKPILPPTENILIIPDGKLNYLPFDALIQHPLTSEDSEFCYYTLPYLLHQYNINYAYSASVLLEKKPRKSTQKLKPFAGFAPEFSNEEFAPKLSSEEIAYIRGELGVLKYNQPEVKAIQEIMGGSAYLNEAATTQHFLDHANKYRIVHFATHVTADDTVQNTGHKIYLQDSVLLADHIYNSSLNADLVVLSACETNQGKLIEGEGVMSLARAFRYIGCPSLTASLWSVDDKSTAKIMIDFYKNLYTGEAQDQALTNSKRNYFKQLEACEDAHPFYWASFVHVGDTSAITSTSTSCQWLWLVLGFLIILAWWKWQT